MQARWLVLDLLYSQTVNGQEPRRTRDTELRRVTVVGTQPALSVYHWGYRYETIALLHEERGLQELQELHEVQEAQELHGAQGGQADRLAPRRGLPTKRSEAVGPAGEAIYGAPPSSARPRDDEGRV